MEDYDYEKVDEMVLALMYLTLHDSFGKSFVDVISFSSRVVIHQCLFGRNSILILTKKEGRGVTFVTNGFREWGKVPFVCGCGGFPSC